MLWIINGKRDLFSDDFRCQAKSQLLQVGTDSPDFWFNLNLVMPFCNLEELELLLNYAFSQYSKIKIDDENLATLKNILVGYIERTYRKKEYAKTQCALRLVDKLPRDADLALGRMIINYYAALLKKDTVQVEEIQKFLQKAGYTVVPSKLPQLEKRLLIIRDHVLIAWSFAFSKISKRLFRFGKFGFF